MHKSHYWTLIIGLVFFGLLTVSAGAEEGGSLLSTTSNQTYTQQLNLLANNKYRVAFNIRTTELEPSNPIVSFAVELYDIKDQRIGINQVQRGLSGTDWHTITLEFSTPPTLASATIQIQVDSDREFWWDSLRITRLDQSIDGIREFWEEKFEKYDRVYTGLVVDATGLGLWRGMSPKIWSESGQLIYGGMNASHDYLQTIGLVSYGKELTGELLQQIQADASYPLALPLVVKAIDVLEPAKSSVVISDEAAAEIMEALAAYDFLARFAVIFIYD